MAERKMLLSLVLVIGAAAAAPTAAPNPCTTATKPPNSCATFRCPRNSVPKAGTILCGNDQSILHTDRCSSSVCCKMLTTVTTTPGTTVTTTPATTVTTTPAPPSCCSFTCPAGFASKKAPPAKLAKNAGPCAVPKPVCIACRFGKCDKQQCCDVVTTVTTTPATTVTTTPATTVTTTPAPATCCGFTCAAGSLTIPAPPTKAAIAAAGPCGTVAPVCNSKPCAFGKCSQKQCCYVPTTVTTTPATTVTTTPATTITTTPPPPTCASFTCGAGSSPKNSALVCANRKCTQAQCCQVNPCGTVAPARLYDSEMPVLAQDTATSKTAASAMPSWALTVFGVFGMFSCAAVFVARTGHGRRPTRRVQLVEPMYYDEMGGLDNALE